MTPGAIFGEAKHAGAIAYATLDCPFSWRQAGTMPPGRPPSTEKGEKVAGGDYLCPRSIGAASGRVDWHVMDVVTTAERLVLPASSTI